MKKSLSFFFTIAAFGWAAVAQAGPGKSGFRVQNGAEDDMVNEPAYKLSTESEQHWYYIVNQGKNGYSEGKVMSCEGNGVKVTFGEKFFMADRIWSLWEGADGKLAIKNYNNIYVGTAPAGTGSSTMVKGTDTKNAIYTITPGEGFYIIGDGTGAPLHAARDNGQCVLRWNAVVENGGPNASYWSFEEVDMSSPEVAIGSTQVQQGKVTTGIGNRNVPIIRSTVNVAGLDGELKLTGLKGRVVATSLSDVTGIRLYKATDARELFVDADKKMPWREENGELLGEGTILEDGTYTISVNTSLPVGASYLWVALDIAEDAKEGNTVDATITGYVVDGKDVAEKNGNPRYQATIFLAESSVLMPMDKGSLYYRIPAIAATADGKRLVTLTDDRINHGADLPNHCYVVAQYSDDGGKSWSEPKRVAGTATTGGDYGHGDAQIITNRITGEIIGIMTSSPTSNAGFWGSTVEKPQAWKVMKSKDGGLTWSVPVNHTRSLYAQGSPNPNIEAGFSGSGAGLQKRDGTLISPFVGRNTDKSQHYYNFISKDGGDTWELYGKSGTTAADEPKVLERNNGDLAISVRTGGYNFHNVSTNDGLTWTKSPQTRFNTGISGNACDGEYMVWSSKLDGNPWNIVLQTGPNSGSRENVSIALSTDEGETFGTPKTICPAGSAYSAATVLPDGTLGVYYEENGVFGGYTMRFVRFSLDWASNGKYKFTDEQPFHPVQTQVTATIRDFGKNTLMLPFDAELPNGLKAYTMTGETRTLGSGDDAYRAILLDPIEGNRLKAHKGYVIEGEAGSYTFRRPISEWKNTSDTWHADLIDGVMRGWYVNDKVKGDGQTIYKNLLNVQAIGCPAFSRVSKSSQGVMSPYCCSLQLTTADEQYLRPVTREVADGISSVGVATSAASAYNLQGMPHRKGQREIVVKNGKKMVEQ